jgi:hypothetical protein
MHQADTADSIRPDDPSSGNEHHFTGTRRGVLAALVAGPLLAGAAFAEPGVRQVRSSIPTTDPAVLAYEALMRVDEAHVSEDVDSVAFQRWEERYEAAEARLLAAPARTGRGMAAKLKAGMETNLTETGERLIAQVIAQLERLS